MTQILEPEITEAEILTGIIRYAKTFGSLRDSKETNQVLDVYNFAKKRVERGDCSDRVNREARIQIRAIFLADVF